MLLTIATTYLVGLRRAFGLAWLAIAGGAMAGELVIEQRVADDGALIMRYTPPEGVRELPLFNRSGTMATVWGEMASPTDACGTVTLKPRTVVTLAANCTTASFRIVPSVLRRNAVYEPAFPVGPHAVMGYTGYYAVALPGHALRWRWVPAEGSYVVVAGSLSAHAVDRLIPANQVDIAAADEGRTAAGWDALAANEYAFLGKADIVALDGGTLIHDGRLDAARLATVRSTLASGTARLAAAYGVAPAGPWTVVASTSAKVPSFHGDVTAGRMMSLRFNDGATQQAPSEILRQTTRFVLHELTHWWDTGVYRTDMDRPWIHEGHADWMAGLLMRETGQLDATRWRSDLDVALNDCQFARGDLPAASLPKGHGRHDDTYACGQILMLMAQWERADRNSPVDVAASLFRGSTTPIDAQMLARWADAGPSGPMHRLLLDPQVGFRTALSRDWTELVEAYPLQSGEPAPPAILKRLTGALMVALMSSDCGGNVGFWTQADHFVVDKLSGCKVLRADMRVRRLAGVSPFEDPVGAWRAVRSACLAGHRIEIGTDVTDIVSMDCPTPLPEMPIQQILRLRPQALERVGPGP